MVTTIETINWHKEVGYYCSFEEFQITDVFVTIGAGDIGELSKRPKKSAS